MSMTAVGNSIKPVLTFCVLFATTGVGLETLSLRWTPAHFTTTSRSLDLTLTSKRH